MPTQAERSASTRQALIDAATQLLIEQGYAAFGEARVCEMAGISRGSLRHQFPEGRYTLLPAMVEQLIDTEAARLAALGPMPSASRVSPRAAIQTSRMASEVWRWRRFTSAWSIRCRRTRDG
ncbi:TetR/AcrR family transcriptional regulator, partial [Paenibacillus sp. 2TAB26]|uniref:TetR/AcrR family transcriptional regulator n=1 Tax=Paenibacillus sp. 2TAB26 TaxID=3233005 RepID=UPI003F95A60C